MPATWHNDPDVLAVRGRLKELAWKKIRGGDDSDATEDAYNGTVKLLREHPGRQLSEYGRDAQSCVMDWGSVDLHDTVLALSERFDMLSAGAPVQDRADLIHRTFCVAQELSEEQGLRAPGALREYLGNFFALFGFDIMEAEDFLRARQRRADGR